MVCFVCLFLFFFFYYFLDVLHFFLFQNTNDGIADIGNFMRDNPFGLPCMHEGWA